MPLSADSRLVLIRVKIERAKQQLRELEAEAIAFRDKRQTVVIREPDPDAREAPNHFVKLPLLPWNVIAAAGDVVHNLRSALDHLAYQLAVVGNPGSEPSRCVEFPIAKDMATYESTKGRKVKGILSEAVKAIDELKPYKGGNDALWRIHELDNINKHRTLFTVGRDFLLIADWMPNLGPYLMKTSDPHFASVGEADVESDMQLEIEKAISKPQVVDTDALLPSLRQLADFVESLVMAFRPFLS